MGRPAISPAPQGDSKANRKDVKNTTNLVTKEKFNEIPSRKACLGGGPIIKGTPAKMDGAAWALVPLFQSSTMKNKMPNAE